MASSKKNKNTTPQDQALAAKRVAFVKSKPDLTPVEARTRFFVQTRAAELQAKGVEVTKQKRQELRQKFASGGVQRQGFYTPADIARAAAAKNTVTPPTVTPPTGVAPQSLADYKNTVYSNLDKENTARRPLTSPKRNPLGINDDFYAAIKDPIGDFQKSPVGRGITWIGKTASDVVLGTAESLSATFVNPSLNQLNRGLDKLPFYDGSKVPHFREAGALESAINVADVILTAATFGAAKGVTTVPFAAARRSLVRRAGTRAITKIDDVIRGSKAAGQIVRGTDDYAEIALKNLGKGPKSGTVDLATGAYKAPIKTAAKNTAKNTAKSKAAGEIVTGADDYLKVALKDLSKGPKSGTVDLATGAYKAPAKSVAPKSVAPKSVAPKATTPKATTPKATTKTSREAGKARFEATRTQARKDVNASNWKDPNNRFADAWDDGPVDMSKIDFMESAPRYSTARRPTVKAADAAPAPKAPAKTTKPKAQAKAGFKAKVNEVKSTPVKATGKPSFKSQAEYNNWLKGGGKEVLRNMTQGERNVFLKANEKFVAGAAAKAQQAAATQAKTTQRSLAAQARYRNARPELQAKFNQALLNRQKRQLLAKIAPKK